MPSQKIELQSSQNILQKDSCRVLPGLKFTPHQSTSVPINIFFVSHRGIRIEFNNFEDKWTIKDAGSNFTGKSQASQSSFALGRHNWTIEGDPKCPGKEYALKLTSCLEKEEFTCHDGECINMDGRCDHVFDCEDR